MATTAPARTAADARPIVRADAASPANSSNPLHALQTALIPLLAVVAGSIHLAHNYLPMGGPSGGPPPNTAGGPLPGAGGPPPGSGGLMSLVMPHLTQVMLLNFVAFVGLAALFLLVGRARPRLRVVPDVLFILLCAATLYAWNGTGRTNPLNTGTMALVVESLLILLAAFDAITSAVRARRLALQPA